MIYFILLILLLLFLIIQLSKNTSYNLDTNYNLDTSYDLDTSYNLDTSYDLIDTGDLVYFIHKGKYHFITNPMRPVFSHIAMIIKDPNTNIKYILEIHATGDKKGVGVSKEGGIHFYNYHERLQNYTGDIYISKLNPNKLPSNDNIQYFINNIENHKNNIQFDEKFKLNYIKKCILLKQNNNVNDKDNKDLLNCCEFVGFVLKQLKITPDNFNNKCTLPISQRYSFLFNESQLNKILFNSHLI